MNGWFTIEKLDGSTFAISEYNHWEQTHCYLLCGNERALLIDTGLGISNLRAVVEGLTSLPVTAVATHVHWDHIGGHGYFDTILVHEAEGPWLSGGFPLPLQTVKENLLLHPCVFPEDFSADDYEIYQGGAHGLLCGGDSIDLGNRQVQVLHTPGHSPGHCCFYEEERKYLYSGDLIYSGCLDAFYPSTDPRQFLDSVRKIRRLDISRIFPGHHTLDIPVGLAGRVETGFCSIQERGLLTHGSGIFEFGAFQIHI